MLGSVFRDEPVKNLLDRKGLDLGEDDAHTTK